MALNAGQLKRLARINIEENELTLERFGLGINPQMSALDTARWFELQAQIKVLSDERREIVVDGRAHPAKESLPEQEPLRGSWEVEPLSGEVADSN